MEGKNRMEDTDIMNPCRSRSGVKRESGTNQSLS
jgi:hypothetical protein